MVRSLPTNHAMSKRCLAGIVWLGAILAVSSPGHAQVLLSEFQAANVRTLNDEDGHSEDWIELYNAGDLPVDLAGWSLTDEADRPSKWVFPSTNIGPGQFLIVFASGKDRRVPGHPLHTDFGLSASGDYLALVKPDRQTPATEYAPAYPPQANDISYGLPIRPVDACLLELEAAGRFFVPRNDVLGTHWMQPEFDDTAWAAVTTGVGFNVSNPLLGSNVETLMRGVNPTAYLRLPFIVTRLADLNALKLRLRYNDGFVAYLNGVPVAHRNAPVFAPGGVYANSESDWSLIGQQGVNNWYYGFYNRAADADGQYDAERDFVSSHPQWAWNGGAWVLGPANPPLDTITQGGWYPNGQESGGVHWVIRRWVCEAPGTFTCQLACAKEDPTCGSGATVRVFLNGAEQCRVTLAFDDITGIRTNLVLADLVAGDALDFALDPLGTDGSLSDRCDGLTFSAVIEQVPAQGATWNSAATGARSPSRPWWPRNST